MKQKSGNKDHHNSQQRKNQRIGEPSFTPAGESQSKTNEVLFLSFRILLAWHVHTRSFRFGSGLCPTF